MSLFIVRMVSAKTRFTYILAIFLIMALLLICQKFQKQLEVKRHRTMLSFENLIFDQKELQDISYQNNTSTSRTLQIRLPSQTFGTPHLRVNSKIILMWNTWDNTMTNGPLVNAQCPVTECLFTRDESLINQSDIVVLYVQTLKDFPMSRNPKQRFVFAQLESPITHDLPGIFNDHRLRYGYFNWTMTYRWDSDIVHRGEYGYIMAKTAYSGNGIRARSLQDWSKQKGTVVEQAELSRLKGNFTAEEVIKKKKKLVAWFVSHCLTPIRREEYVRQLSKHITIDVFGGCNNRDCPYSCDKMLRTEYKFYLAFENSWCADYVTEKFYRPLINDAVPIVMGGADYSRFAPPNSYINARDFNSPKDLAAYIMVLDQTNSLYAKYFEWKKYFDILRVDNYGLCELCRMAHDITLPYKIYPDIKQWWIDNRNCENNTLQYF